MMELLEVSRVDPGELTALWSTVFGDPPELAAAFLSRLPAIGTGFAAVEDGRVCGAAYWIDALEIAGEKCGYLYAVAVKPEARGRGLGAALSRACFETGRARGAVYCCTEPAEPSLFAWYEKILGLRCVLYRQKTALESAAFYPVTPLSAADYAARREELLAGRPHLRATAEALAYEKTNCRCFGGDLYAVGDGIAAAGVEEDGVLVRECLGSDPERLAASVGAHLGGGTVTLLSAADEGKPFLAANRPFPPGTVWNLAFD